MTRRETMSKSAFKLLLTLTCDESTRLVSESLDRSLRPAERWAVRLHAISCRSCRRYRKQLAFLRSAIARLGRGDTEAAASISLDPDAKERIRRALAEASEKKP
jgi:hypothetical protein